MLGKSTGGATVKEGGDTWFFITADYVFGQTLERDTTQVINKAGGKVLGSIALSVPGDYRLLGHAGARAGVRREGARAWRMPAATPQNCIKQAQEFGLMKTMKVAALLIQSTGVHALGLATAQGLRWSESYYWDLNDRTRAFNERIRTKTPNGIWPNMTQAGDYAVTLHYLKTVADMGVAAAKADGRAAVARMKAMPTDDDCFGPGKIREDGRALHPVLSVRGEDSRPRASRHGTSRRSLPTTPMDEAFRPMSEGDCPLVKA